MLYQDCHSKKKEKHDSMEGIQDKHEGGKEYFRDS